jgi:undecaprenyl-diphosphatase
VSLSAAVLLGIIQGLTEFLPVSSSAHLILARAFFGWELPADVGLVFDVALHVGTLLAILVFFRAEILELAGAVPRMFSGRDRTVRLLWLIAVGTVPVVIVGLLLADVIERVMRTPAVAAAALTFGGLLMVIAERTGSASSGEDSIGWPGAFLIGCAQASALVPGMSRSGTTIAVGMFLGLRREGAARFTFLLAVPAMIAAAGKESLELTNAPLPEGSAGIIVTGVVVSAVVGYVTIKYFLRFLATHRLDIFAVYRFILAAATVVWLLKG